MPLFCPRLVAKDEGVVSFGGYARYFLNIDQSRNLAGRSLFSNSTQTTFPRVPATFTNEPRGVAKKETGKKKSGSPTRKPDGRGGIVSLRRGGRSGSVKNTSASNLRPVSVCQKAFRRQARTSGSATICRTPSIL